MRRLYIAGNAITGNAIKFQNQFVIAKCAEWNLWIFSAGIGRTGVLILMETAMCLIEANEPVYPLDIVRKMRDQRAMLIQNAVSTFDILARRST